MFQHLLFDYLQLYHNRRHRQPIHIGLVHSSFPHSSLPTKTVTIDNKFSRSPYRITMSTNVRRFPIAFKQSFLFSTIISMSNEKQNDKLWIDFKSTHSNTIRLGRMGSSYLTSTSGGCAPELLSVVFKPASPPSRFPSV